MRLEAEPPITIGNQRAVRAEFQCHGAGAAIEAVVDQRVRIGEPGNDDNVVVARQADIGEADDVGHDGACPVLRPKPQAQICVERNHDAGRARRVDRRVAGVRGARRNGERYARKMQHAGTAYDGERQIDGAHAARRGACPEERELVAILAVCHEIDARRGVLIALHRARVDPLARP